MYVFEKQPTATFKFTTNSGDPLKSTQFSGINASLSTAEPICQGVASLMAIGGNEPGFDDAIRTSKETVYDNME